ncbi:MAG TPA: hypothetical protein VK806_00210 [Bacteroidia bacterium]|jgi:hypothetical protein|nr:hypothetical protein [Bacteroidia bacterium]
MKIQLKRIAVSLLITGACLYVACNKDNTTPSNTQSTFSTYSSIQDFYAQNGVPMQSYSVNGSAGGHFTTPQGTIVTIPANSFIDKGGNPITGTVTIEFKDIYTKSDMLLSNMPPQYYGTPLKSGGEFFIRAKSAGNAVNVATGKSITIKQPLNSWAADNNMIPFVGMPDTIGNKNWVPKALDSIGGPGEALADSATGYVWSLYSFGTPVDSGTWCNSDNSSYFSAYPQTTLTIQTTDSINSGTSVFLLFNNLSSMVHVYQGTGKTFPYNYAPQGLQCTIVAVEVMFYGQFRCCFTPITITANSTVNFSCSPSTISAFKAQLSTYNH